MNIDLLCMGCMNEKGKDNSCPHCGFNEKQVSLELSHFLPIRTILNGQYVIGQVLGSGGFGITYLAWDLVLESKLAIKEFFPSEFVTRVQGKSEVSVYGGTKKVNFEQSKQAFLDEARKLVKFEDNPGVVSVRTYFEANGTAYIVMPYLEGLTLKEYLDLKEGKLSFEQALSIMNPVLNALKEVHQHGLLHRDISPDNIYLTNNGQVKLLDFGAARYAIGDFSKSLSVILKHGYAPLEQYQSKGAQGPWTDIYAVAATIYRMVSGKMLPEALERLDDDPLEPLANLGVIIPPDAEKVLFKALAVRPKNRYQYVLEFQDALKETVQIPEFKIDKYIVVNCPCCGEQNRVPFHAAKLLNSVECKTCSNSNTPPVANEIKPEIIGNKDETEIIYRRETELLDDRKEEQEQQKVEVKKQKSEEIIKPELLKRNEMANTEYVGTVESNLTEFRQVQSSITKPNEDDQSFVLKDKKKGMNKKVLVTMAIVLVLLLPAAVYGIINFKAAKETTRAIKLDNEKADTKQTALAIKLDNEKRDTLDEWAVKVNGFSILIKDYDVRVNDAKQIYEKQGADFTSEQGKKDLPQLKSQILDRMIERQVIAQENKKLGIKADDPKVKAEEEGIKKNMGTDAQFQEVLKQQGMTESESLNFLALYLKQTSDLKLSDSDIKAYFDKNQDQYGQPEQVKARHILLKTEDEAKQIIAQLKAGGKFEQLAKEKSIEPGAKDSGGDLGYFSKGKMVPDFEKAAFAQKVGTYSTEPVKTEFGYHVILVEDHKQASVPDYAKIKDTVEKDALNQAKDEKFQTYYDELRKQANIEYAPGYDPAAPPALMPNK